MKKNEIKSENRKCDGGFCFLSRVMVGALNKEKENVDEKKSVDERKN